MRRIVQAQASRRAGIRSRTPARTWPAPDTAAADGAKGHAAAAEAMHSKCCDQCKDAQSKDRSGANPDEVPCADYVDLQPWCTEHFRAKPTMASACK